MRWIIIGVVLDIIGVAAFVVLIFLPMAFNDNAGLNSFYARLFCEPGDQYIPETTSHATSDGGTGYNLFAQCVGERGTVDITPKQTIIAIAAGGIPLVLATGLQILGGMLIKQRNNRPREVTHLMRENRESRPVSVSPADNPISWSQSSAPTGRTLSEKLAEIDDAYDSRRISREEYEALRKKAIDETNY